MENLRVIFNGVEYIERWEPIVDYEELYKISTFGRVLSLHGDKGKILKKRYDPKGYVRYMLCNGISQKQFKAHRLTSAAYIPNPLDLPQVNHLDEIKDNNFYLNLKWCDNRENKNHSCNPRSTSIHPGVSWDKSRSRWLSQCWFNGKRRFIGYFKDELQAAESYRAYLDLVK